MPNILDLPMEVQCLVTAEVAIGDEPDTWDRKSLQSLRLTCKALNASSFRIFGTAFLTKRKHIITGYSIGELLTITEHQAFGLFVKHIQIEAVCKEVVDPETYPLVNKDVFVWSGGFCGVMQKIFENIKVWGNGVTIGISQRDPSDCFGWKRLAAGHPYHYTLAETFSQTIKAVEGSEVAVRGLELEFRRSGVIGEGWDEQESLEDVAYHFLSGERGRNINFKFSSGVDSAHRVSYDFERQSIEITDDLVELETCCPGYILHSWLHEHLIREFTFSACVLDTAENVLSYFPFIENLRQVTLEHVSLEYEDDWSLILNFFADECKLTRCCLCALTSWVTVDEWRYEYTTELPTGHDTVFITEGDSVGPDLREIARLSKEGAAAWRPEDSSNGSSGSDDETETTDQDSDAEEEEGSMDESEEEHESVEGVEEERDANV